MFWTLSAAESNGSNEEIRAIFEDFRNDVSNNLKRLLRDVPELSVEDLDGEDD